MLWFASSSGLYQFVVAVWRIKAEFVLANFGWSDGDTALQLQC